MQYLTWIRGIVTEGDFGFSFVNGRPVSSLIWERLGWTVFLALLAVRDRHGASASWGRARPGNSTTGDYGELELSARMRTGRVGDGDRRPGPSLLFGDR